MINSKEYVIEMRKAFSNKNCISPNGELNHKYFQNKIGQNWTEEESQKLLHGLSKHGVGAWTEMKNDFLKNWSETELKLRTGQLLKCFNVDKYNGRKLSDEEIAEIAEENEKEGKSKGKFKYGINFN